MLSNIFTMAFHVNFLKTILLSSVTLILFGCGIQDSIKEKEQITFFKLALHEILEQHSKDFNRIHTIERAKQRQQASIDALANLYKEYRINNNQEQLNTVIDLYEYAWSSLLSKNLQVLNAMEPILRFERARHVRDEQHFNDYILRTAELLYLTENFEKEIATHFEAVMIRVYQSDLDQSVKGKLWTEIKDRVQAYHKREGKMLSYLQDVVVADRNVVSYLFDNQKHFKITETDKLSFANIKARFEYESLEFKLEYSIRSFNFSAVNSI